MVSTGTDVVAARELLDQAEHRCLIANSLRGSHILEAQVIAEDARGSCLAVGLALLSLHEIATKRP